LLVDSWISLVQLAYPNQSATRIRAQLSARTFIGFSHPRESDR
jgi:hypothetical protein